MNKKLSACLSLLALGAATAWADSFRTDINPALLYYQGYIMTPDLAQADRDYLFNTDWRGQKLPDRVGQLLNEYDHQFNMVRQAAHSTVPCDWGIDMSPGPATLLPQLARNKGISLTAKLRAMWDLQHGRPTDASEDLLAALALARNCSRDGTLISILVQIAMEQIICGAVAENFYQFPTEVLKQFAEGMERIPPRGTMASSIKTEKAFFYDWMVGKIVSLQKNNPGDDRKVMTGIQELLAGIEGPGEGDQPPTRHWEQVVKSSGGKSEGVLRLLREQGALYPQAASLLALPRAEYEAQIQSFLAQIAQSQNPFISLSFPAIAKARPKEFAAETVLAMVQAAVQYRLRGDTGLQSVMDPSDQGPFTLERFNFEGVDRGFALHSSYDGRGFPETLIFLEKEGPMVFVSGKNAGQAVPPGSAVK